MLVRVVGEGLEDPAITHRAPGAVGNHSLKLNLEASQSGDALGNVIQVMLDNRRDGHA